MPRPGRPRRTSTPRYGLNIRREKTREGYCLHFTGKLATSDLIDVVLPERNVTRLNWLAVGMLSLPFLSGLLTVFQRYHGAKAGEGIIYDLRQQMYEHLQRMSLRFFTHTKSGEIISRFNNDVVGAQSAITGTLPNIITNVITLVSTLIVMISIEWRLAFLSVIVLPLFLLPARRVARTFGAGQSLLVVEGIPMWSCPHCGESYFTAQTMHELERIKALRKSVAVRKPVSVAEFQGAGA